MMTSRLAPRSNVVLLVMALVLLGCSEATTADSQLVANPTTPTKVTTTTAAPAKETGSATLGPRGREAELVAPDSVSGPAPLLVLLHGFGITPERGNEYFDATEQASDRGLYVLLPGGTADESDKQFWDANDACCNETGTPVDDFSYLRDLIEQALEERPIDPGRVYIMGYSNGGFMTYRLACDAADLVTAVAVVAGADAPTAEECKPVEPVSVLHLHGDADRKVRYGGGDYDDVPYPGAVESVTRWAARNGCDEPPVEAPPIDLDAELPGAETMVSRYEGCPEGVDVQLATITGAEHKPDLIGDQVGVEIFDWLLAHAR